MRQIGGSIQEAIDWTQDHLGTTRPLAERTLFTLLTEKRAQETEAGFMLGEVGDEEIEKVHNRIKHRNIVQRVQSMQGTQRIQRSQRLRSRGAAQYIKKSAKAKTRPNTVANQDDELEGETLDNAQTEQTDALS